MNTSAPDLAADIGISLRQIGHWIDRGYARAALAHPGSGHGRWFTASEARRVRVLAVLVHAGFTPHAAATLIEEGTFVDASASMFTRASFRAVVMLRNSELRIEVETV